MPRHNQKTPRGEEVWGRRRRWDYTTSDSVDRAPVMREISIRHPQTHNESTGVNENPKDSNRFLTNSKKKVGEVELRHSPLSMNAWLDNRWVSFSPNQGSGRRAPKKQVVRGWDLIRRKRRVLNPRKLRMEATTICIARGDDRTTST